MPCLFGFLSLFFPRLVIVILYLFSSFFNGVYSGILLPILGFLFMPVTLLAYTYSINSAGPGSNTGIILIIIAVIIDLGLWGNGYRSRKKK